MQEYAGSSSNKNEYRDGAAESARERGVPSNDGYQPSQHHYSVISHKSYGCSNKDTTDPNIATYCRVATGIYEATASNQKYQNSRYNNTTTAPSFCSPPHSPLVGLVFDPSSPNYNGPGMSCDRNSNSDRRSQNAWSVSHQEPIGTGAKKKIVKNHDNRNTYNVETRYHDKYKDSSTETERQNKDRNLTSESTSSLDFFAEGEKMVSELCNIESSLKAELNNQKQNSKLSNQDDDKSKASGSSDLLLTALDKIVIHDQIPNQIVQLAVEACTDAENIAIAHHNRPCFKNIHSICAKTRSNVQKPDSAVANLHSQGIPWVIKNFIFSFVRILDGWKGVKELLSEKHDTFSRIENKYYSPNIRECFVQWQAVTKEMLTHIYKTFKTLDHGFTMEQKSFTHNYYATNSAAPRHQNQKFQPIKPQVSTPRHVNSSPQTFNAMQPPWVQSQSQGSSQTFSEPSWPVRPGVTYKKFPVVPPPNTHNFYPLNDQNEVDNYQKSHYKCDPCIVREAKPRQSWTITNVPDFRALEGMCHSDQRELYSQLKHKMDAELGKAPGQPLMGNTPFDLLQRREMELKAKMIPLSHVEKTLIPSMATGGELRGCFVQKNNSCGDTKEDADFFATWGQMVQKEPNDFITHHSHNIQIPSNVVTIPNNISGPVQFIDPENDEFHEMSKVYMKPGSYKVPIKPSDPVTPFMSGSSQDVFDSTTLDEMAIIKMKNPFSSVTLAPQPKYSMEAWPCLVSRRNDDVFADDQKLLPRNTIGGIDLRGPDALELLTAKTSDRAWEAAKQSAPKLMDFLHEGSKSDTARLYDALGLNSNDEYCDEMRQVKLGADHCDVWSSDLSSNHFMAKNMPNIWSQTVNKQDFILAPNKDQSFFTDDDPQIQDAVSKLPIVEDHVENMDKIIESKENPRCPNFDKTGNYVRDENQKKPNGKTKVAASGMWYHPKKKKPLSAATVKKFETIISNLLQLKESNFIQHDMDIKMAPRFYEVVKYPMCLHDISTKLKNSSYTEYEQVVQDFKRIFNNVRLYLKSYPDSNMKKDVNKISSEFEKLLSNELEKLEAKTKIQENSNNLDNKPFGKDNDMVNQETNKHRNDDVHKKNDVKTGDDKK